MLNTLTPETTPFTLAAIVPVDSAARFIRQMHTLNVDKFLGFPPDWLFIAGGRWNRCEDSPDLCYLRIEISESIHQLATEASVQGQPVWNRVSFTELFEGFAVVPASSDAY